MNKFVKHTRNWFNNRVGEIVQREFCKGSKRDAVKPEMPESFMITSESHAKALYNFHVDNRINIKEV